MAQLTRIDSKHSVRFFFKELWEYRELFFTFAWRDFRVRYAQTALGLLWGVIQPVLTILILWLVFGRFIQVDMEGIPPIAFIAAGVSCWTYFSFVLTQSGQSIIQSQQMVKKIYFPKIILPFSKAFLGLVDLLIAQVVLFIILIFSSVPFTSMIFFLPLVLISLLMVSVGLGTWTSALTIKYRDIQQIVPFLVQLGLYITPIAYPASMASKYLPEWAMFVYYANPLTGIVETLRFILFGTGEFGLISLYSFGVGLLIAISGVIYFQLTQKRIADLV